MSSVITISQPPSIPGGKSIPEVPTEMTFAPMDPDTEDLEAAVDVKSDGESSDFEATTEQAKAQARNGSLAKLQGTSSSHPDENHIVKKLPPAQATVRRRVKNGPDAVVVLKEEKVGLFLKNPPISVMISRLRRAPFMIFSNLCTRSKLLLSR